MTSPWIELLGRLHPALLHLPIGLWVGIGVLEYGSVLTRRAVPAGAVSTLAWLAALTGIGAGVSGWVLGGSGEYAGELLESHKWFGVGTTALGLVAALVSHRPGRAFFRLALLATLGVGAWGGHLGGSLTHGTDFLQQPIARILQGGDEPHEAEESPSDASTYAAVVAPILERTCTSCHGETKQKGGLSLHTKEAILAGGDTGPSIEPGNAKASLLVERMHLPLEDEDRMPPEGKPQPSAQEIAALEKWIDAGAPFEGKVAGIDRPSDVVAEPVIDHSAPVTPASGEAVAALRTNLVHVQRITEGAPQLWIDFSATAATVDDTMARKLLEPVVRQVGELGLSRAAVTDRLMPMFARMSSLRRLDLRQTAVGSDGIEELVQLPKLEELVLVQTKVDDAVVESLLAMPALQRVFLWNTKLTPEALGRLREQRPTLRVETGEAAETNALEVEPPPPGTAPAAPAPAGLKPVNDVCPVSGTAVDAQFSVVHDGKVVGFCCPNCPKTFWTDPAKYPVKAR
ncbi:MAG: hypothetical protein RL148_2202 [Planctomycetota bacterium]